MQFPAKTSNTWMIGKTVNIGFMKGFYVIDHIQNPDRFDPWIWVLVRNETEYHFTPHKGLFKVGPYVSPALMEMGAHI